MPLPDERTFGRDGTNPMIDSSGNSTGSPYVHMVTSGTDNEVQKLAEQWNLDWDASTKDFLTQYYLSDKLAQRNYDRELTGDNTKYQRAMQDLINAGLNPAQVLGSLSGSSPGSSGNVSGNSYTQEANSKRQASTDLSTKWIGVLAIVAAAFIYSLL